VTFAEFRDRRKIGDIEHYSKQRIQAHTIPGLEPKTRFEQRPPRAGFGGKPGRPGERRHGNGNGNGGGYGQHSRFGAKSCERRDGGFGGGRNEGGFGGGRREGGFGGGRDNAGRDFGGRGRPAR